MLWKKLLLEGTAIGGFGGGIGGYFGTRSQVVEIPPDEESPVFSSESSISKKKQESGISKAGSGIVPELDHAVLGSWKYQSEGVEDELMFVSGWDNEGQNEGRHRSIGSEKVSQGKRQFWGGRHVSYKSKWFGPRNREKEIQALEEAKRKMAKESYWPTIQKAGGYISEEDLKGISNKWKERNYELESQILELYKPRWWWESKLGKWGDKDRIALEIELDWIKKMLAQDENSLRENDWTYGKVADNSKLRFIRTLGDPESVLWNYIRKYLWETDMAKKYLKEVNLIKVVSRLINGEKVGFDCERGREWFKNGAFEECKKDPKVSSNGAEVKSVLKSVVPRFAEKWIPIRRGFGSWRDQHYEREEWKELYKSYDFEGSKVLNEKCEPDRYLWFLLDTKLKIRQEVCDLIIRPWFGDQVSEKRLCLIEVKNHKNYLRLNTYLNAIQIPTWHSKNAFWTKCANYGI